jgi:predicted AlkP superfamily pyrophosphatase or phosphodiesterase
VLLLEVDGCRPDALRKVVESGRAPAFHSLIERGSITWNAHTGGETGTETEQATWSGPGWSSVLTGVWRNKHGVADNRFKYNRIAQWPHFMRRLKESVPSAWTASLCDWPEIHRIIVGASRTEGADFVNFEFLATPDPALKGRDYGLRDSEVTARAVEHLASADPDVISVYFGQVDEVGHAVGDPAGKFSPDNEPYLSAIADVDHHVGQLLAALRARPQFAQEDWLILATTDHGGRDTTHGGPSAEERTIWMLASGGQAPKGALINEPVAQTAIPATVFTHLGIPSKSEWGWESGPFALQPRPAVAGR